MNKSVTIYAPASLGNISVGFDLLGSALLPIDEQLFGDKVTVTSAEKGIALTVTGRYKTKVPKKQQDNIVFQCAEFFINHLDEKKGLHLTLEKNLPIGSGLGSSASSITAALKALNEYFHKPFSSYELMKLMGIFEGRISGSVHYDNIAPCYLGGLQLMIDTPQTLCEPIPEFSNWFWVISYPGIFISTATMRELLPKQYDRETTINFGRQLAAFIHASYKQDSRLAFAVLKDVLAEPYRADAITHFKTVKKELLQMGMQATGISGSGPSLFSLTDELQLAKQAKNYLDKHYVQNQEGFTHICQIDSQGARQL